MRYCSHPMSTSWEVLEKYDFGMWTWWLQSPYSVVNFKIAAGVREYGRFTRRLETRVVTIYLWAST